MLSSHPRHGIDLFHQWRLLLVCFLVKTNKHRDKITRKSCEILNSQCCNVIQQNKKYPIHYSHPLFHPLFPSIIHRLFPSIIPIHYPWKIKRLLFKQLQLCLFFGLILILCGDHLVQPLSIEIWSGNSANFKAPIMSCVLTLERSSRAQILF